MYLHSLPGPRSTGLFPLVFVVLILVDLCNEIQNRFVNVAVPVAAKFKVLLISLAIFVQAMIHLKRRQKIDKE
jgi:hypothetical protein